VSTVVIQYNKPFHFEIFFYELYYILHTCEETKTKTGAVVGRDRMVVAVTTTHAISAYYH